MTKTKSKDINDYVSLEASLHDLFWDAEGESAELPLIREHLSQNPGTSLEIGCGSGRLLIPLLQEGHEVHGNDLSADMINLLKQKLEEADLDTEYFTTPTEQLELSRYRNFLIPAFTLQLMGTAGAAQTLKHIAKQSADNATLYLTVFVPWAEITDELEPDNWYLDHKAPTADGNNAQCFTRYQINRTEQILHRDHHYKVSDGDKLIAEHHCSQQLRWFTLPELRLLLSACGWHIDQIIYDLNPALDSEEDAQLFTITASKSL